ncbi:MAG: DNA topoisomerase IV subunit A [Planctomycetaceae bacterium]
MAKRSARRPKPPRASDSPQNGNATPDQIQFVSISDETRRRYLNYAMSVIMARALPDVRDGLKPVQRRILYVMHHELRLTADAKFRKCAKICGDTTGNYHPHDQRAVYDALVRMAQSFTLRDPLVDGQGNFGSIFGLPAAAERYTEARLTALADHLMQELRFDTVDVRANYDATRQEPVVMPARFPNLLVNGAAGIAVGMATNIPPHNLGEVISGCLALIDQPEASVAQVMKAIKGPDFPLGGRIVTDRRELRIAYEEGRGTIKLRGEWKFDKEKRQQAENRLVIYSIPYGVETGPLMTELGVIRDSRKLPQLLDVVDESSDENGLRIVLHIRSGEDAEPVMAYLYKHTSLEQNFAYNATCLVPDEHGAIVPKRCSLTELLRYFLEFRFATVRRRFQFQLAQLERRIHILEGFAIIFDGLEQALKIIRKSEGKQDASEKLQKAFPLDEEQANAVLELQLYRISQLEIGRIKEELAEKRAEAERIRTILKSDRKLWGVVRAELNELGTQFGTPRRTTIGTAEEITEFDPQAYILKENTNVVVSADGWIRRVGRTSGIDKLRVRDGDSVLAVVPASTLDHVVFFCSDGTAYTLPVSEIPASTGYGEPLAKHVKLKDGASVIAAITTDARFTPADVVKKNSPPSPYLFVATANGQVLRLSFTTFRQPSTKAGRRFCRLGKGDRAIHAEFVSDKDTLFLISKRARLIHFSTTDVPILSGPGKGVRGLKLVEPGDEVLGARKLSRPGDTLKVINDHHRELAFGQHKYTVTSRGGKGVKTSQRTGIRSIVPPEITLVEWEGVE